MDKFEHEKHNRRERVYKYPRINLLPTKEVRKRTAQREAQRESDNEDSRCLILYRDFFRDPHNNHHLENFRTRRKLLDLPSSREDDLRRGQKVFSKFTSNSEKYREFMTPLDLWFWDPSNSEMISKYRTELEKIAEEKIVQKNQDDLKRLRRTRFELD
jgi:hypothetical protein